METSREAHDSFSAWARSRQDGLLRAAYLLTNDRAQAEDLVQDALVKVARRWGRLRDGHPDAYARRVLYTTQVSWWRRHRETPVPEVYGGSADLDDPDRSIVVRQALMRLPARQRAVVVLRFLDDLTERETAEVLGVSLGTVKSQAHAALRKLRDDAPELAALIGHEGDSR